MSASTKGSYIQAQADRLQQELAQAGDQMATRRAQLLSAERGPMAVVAGQIKALQERLAAEAEAAALQRARRQAWPVALALKAARGRGKSPAPVWIALLAAAWALGYLVTSSIVLAALLFAVGYVLLVRWGRERAAQRASQPERDAIARFRDMTPVLLQFAPHESGDATHPYRGVFGPAASDTESNVQNYRVNKEFGPQFGASFVALRGADLKVGIVTRLPLNGLTVQAIPFNGVAANGLAWGVWKPLVEALAQGLPTALPDALPAFREFVAHVDALEADHSRVMLMKQRLATLEGQERAWGDVALPDDTLNRILTLLDLFKSGRHPAPKGLMLYGPPGTGKTLIARKLAQNHGCNFVSVNVSDLKGKHIGHTAQQVKDIWQRCRKDAPTLLFVDECESVFASRGSTESDSFGAELVQTFLSEWDGFNQAAGQVFVIGATNRHDLIDTAIMSRFTESIEILPPDAAGRGKILTHEFTKARLALQPGEALVRETAGMSGRDLHTLVAKVVAAHLHGALSEEAVLAEVRKLRGKSSTSVERLGWEALILPDATLQEFKSLGKELVHAEELRALGVGVPRGILLYGPPGTGKTQVARVLASESGLSFIAASSSELKAGYIGQSGGKVKQLFEKARAQAPCILFLDEIDTVAQSRGGGDSFTTEIVAQLLQELDGVATKKGQVFLLGASNHLGSIDSALLSRFERKILIDLPDEAARAAILRLQLAGKPAAFDLGAASAAVAARTAGMSGRDLQSLVASATRRALQRAMAESGDPRTLSLVQDDLNAQLPALEPT